MVGAVGFQVINVVLHASHCLSLGSLTEAVLTVQHKSAVVSQGNEIFINKIIACDYLRLLSNLSFVPEKC